jgi:hypothetical protein
MHIPYAGTPLVSRCCGWAVGHERWSLPNITGLQAEVPLTCPELAQLQQLDDLTRAQQQVTHGIRHHQQGCVCISTAVECTEMVWMRAIPIHHLPVVWGLAGVPAAGVSQQQTPAQAGKPVVVRRNAWAPCSIMQQTQHMHHLPAIQCCLAGLQC